MGTLTRDAGRARLTVDGPVAYTSDGRQTWRYTIAEVTRYTGFNHDRVVRETVQVIETGEDLHTGVGGVGGTPREMLATLCTFLSAAAESSSYAMRHGVPLEETENGTLFNHQVLMLAEQESDEIAMLGVELEEGDDQS